MLNHKNWLAAGGLIILLAAGAVVTEALGFPGGPVHVAQAANGGISLDEAVSRVRRQTQGKILSAETVRSDGRSVHRIKVLTQDGRVERLLIDAQNGRPAARRH
jgi:uncharacterized membrane protein YkoI